jgi:cytochrome c5
MRASLYPVALAVALAACGQSPPRATLISNSDRATPELRAACELTERKCTRCHPIGKIFAIDVTSREEWEPIVDRMRRNSASTISMEDAQIVLTCLEQVQVSRAPGD